MAKKVTDEFDQYKVADTVGVAPIDEFDQYKVKKKDDSEISGEDSPSVSPQTSQLKSLDFDPNKPFQFEEKPTTVAADKVLTAPIRPVNQFVNPVTKYETIRKALEDQHVATPKPLGYSPENDRLDVAVNNVIAKKLASDPYEEYPAERPEQNETSWGWGIANNISKGVSSLLNDFGDVLDIVAPFTHESRWKEQQKFKAMSPGEWEKYGEQRKMNKRKENPFHLLSDYYDDLSKEFKPLPDHPAAHAIEGAIGTLPLIAELMLTPEIKAIQLGNVAVNIPKMATLEGLRGYYKGVSSGGNTKDKLKAGFVQGLEGGAFGTIMHSMGFTSSLLGKAVAGQTGSALLGGLTNMATNSGLFGAYDAFTQKMNTGKIDYDQVWSSFGTGAILGIPAVFGGAVADRKNPKLEFSRNLYKKAFNTFMSSSDEAISMVGNMEFNPEKMREMTLTLGDKIAASTEIGEKNKLATQQRLLNNLIEINAMSQDVVTNPDFYKKIIHESDMPEASKDMFVRKVDKLIADTGERQADVDSKIMTAREGNKVQFKAPELFIGEETSKVFNDIELDRPVTNNRLQAASNNLFDEYKRLETTKYSNLRSNTIEEINDAQKFLEKEITNLENQKTVQAERGLFVNLKARGDKERKPVEEPVPEPPKIEPQEAGVLVSPFYDISVNSFPEAKKARENEVYQQHLQRMNQIAEDVGLKVNGIDNTVGGFVNSEGTKVREISNRVRLEGDFTNVEKFAAVVGALAPDVQEATIAARYVPVGDVNHNATEFSMTIKNDKKLLDALKDAGIDDFTYNEQTKELSLLDFSKGESPEFDQKIVNFAKQLKSKRIRYENEQKRPIDSRYIDSGERRRIFESVRSEVEQRQGGTNVRPKSIDEATQRNEEFIKSKEAPKPSEPLPVTEEVKKPSNPVYSAVFVDPKELTDKYKPALPEVSGDHSTIEFKPKDVSDLPIGEGRDMKITGRLTTDKVDVLLVDNPLSKNKHPHITLATAKGVKPFESNAEIEKNLDKIQPLNDVIKGKVGVFEGKQGGKENAIQKQSTAEVDVRKSSENGEGVGGRNAEYKVPTQPKEESSGINSPDDNAPQVRKARVRKQLEKDEKPQAKAAGFLLFGDISDLFRGKKAKRNPLGVVTAWNFVKRGFDRAKGLPKEWFDEYNRTTGAIKARRYDIENAAYDMLKEAKDVYKAKIEKDQLLEIQKAFENLGIDQASRDLVINTVAKNMPVEMLPVVERMRKMLDAYTEELMKLDMIGVDLESKLEKNRGYYVTRTYAKHTNRDWTWDNIPIKIKQDAADVLSDAFPPESAIKGPNDLLGAPKAEWMNRGLKNKIEEAQKSGEMQTALDEGRISAQDYIDFIDAANKPDKKGVSKDLQVPKEVTDQLEKELEVHDDKINGMLKGMLESDDMISSIVSRGKSVVDIDKSQLKKRSKFLTDHPEIREFLGENRDPFYNFAVSMTKMAEMIERGKMIENFRDIGLANGYISAEQSLAKGHTAQIKYNDTMYSGKPGTKKLSDYYTTPEIAEAMSKFFDDQHVTNKWARAYLTAVTAVKLSKTAWSVKGTVRNFKSNVTNFIGNGNWNVHQIYPEFKQRMKNWKEFHRELLERNVIGDNANAGELMRNVQDLTERMTKVDRSDEGFLERAKRKAIDLPLKSYSFVDDVWKVARYISEYTRYRDVYKKRGMNEAEATDAAKTRAMEILHRTSTYYSQLPKFIQDMRKLPFTNTFISFPYLTTSNFLGSLDIAFKEMKSADTALIGAQRLAGAMMGVSVLAATAGIANKKRGQGARKMQAWRRFLPKFWSNDIITIKKDNGDGTATYKNTSYLDYYNAITTPVLMLGRRAMANGEVTSDDLVDAGVEFAKNFLAWDILFERLDDLKDNETPYGKRIYNETEDLSTQYKDIIGYFMGVFEPATSTDVRRIVKAAREGEDWKSQAKGAVFGNQVRSIDPLKSMSYFMLPKYKEELQYAREIYKKTMRDYNRLKNPNDKDREKLAEAKARSESVLNRLLEQIQMDYDAAIEVGVKNSDLQKVIKGAVFDADVRKAIYSRKKIQLNAEGGIIGTGGGLELKP